jgi:fluoroquinolone transport system permease protein
MKRVISALRWDVVLQFRNGFYFVGALFVLLWVGLLRQIIVGAPFVANLAAPAFVMLNMLITTFYFVGGLVLLEKGEGVLDGLVVTPLRGWEYLASKAVSLTFPAIVESVLIVVLTIGAVFQPLPLLAGMALLGGLYVLLGFVAIARYDSINEYLLPSGVLVALLMLPLLDYVGLWRSALFYLHPVQPALVLLRAAFTPIASWEIAYGLVGAALWLALSYFWARRSFARFIVRAAGGSQ